MSEIHPSPNLQACVIIFFFHSAQQKGARNGSGAGFGFCQKGEVEGFELGMLAREWLTPWVGPGLEAGQSRQKDRSCEGQGT